MIALLASPPAREWVQLAIQANAGLRPFTALLQHQLITVCSTSVMLTPNQHDQEVAVEIQVIDGLMDSRNPPFVRAAREFRAMFQPGDVVVEYCTSEMTWQAHYGRAGFKLIRRGVAVVNLVTRLN